MDKPFDMVSFHYTHSEMLTPIMAALVARGHAFIVSPRNKGIAMTIRAAQEIGVYDG